MLSLSRPTVRNISFLLSIGSSAYVYTETRRLARTYPSRSATGPYYTPVLLTSHEPSRYFPPSSTDIFAARIPRIALSAAAHKLGLNDATSLNAAWARTLMNAPTLSAEGQLVGGLKGKGDTGTSGFHQGQALLNGLFTVEQPPSRIDPLVVSWMMPERIVIFFENLASWGYPWRLMSGGRHSIGVVEVAGSDDEIDVIFGCAHEYEWVNRANGKEDGKIIPRWTGWSHKMFGRWILDDAVRQLMKEYEKK